MSCVKSSNRGHPLTRRPVRQIPHLFRPLLPPDLRHSSPSTASTVSTSSAESTYEYHTHSCANAFLFATLQATEVEKYCWWPKPYKIRHAEFFSFRVSLIMSRAQKMKIKVGQSIQGQRVTKVIDKE